MQTTANDVVAMAKQAGMTRGQVLLKVEDFRELAAKANEAGNAALGKGHEATASEKFREQDQWQRLADLYFAAGNRM